MNQMRFIFPFPNAKPDLKQREHLTIALLFASDESALKNLVVNGPKETNLGSRL